MNHTHHPHASHEAGTAAVGAPTPTHTDAAAASDTIYTCPMHPQIRQDHPGSCP